VPRIPKGEQRSAEAAAKPENASSGAALRKLRGLWEREKLATRRQEQSLRDSIPFEERVRRGLALANLRYENTESRGVGQSELWFHLEEAGILESARINVGDTIVLWSPSNSGRQSAVVGRRGQTRLSVVVEDDYAAFVENGPIHLDIETPEVTFERGDAAIQRYLEAEELAPLRELLFGDAEPTFGETAQLTFRDERLNASQRRAVELALRAEQAALLHGPPGTGKTRTLVEVVRQQLLLGRSVLVTAASNTAVDHLARQLARQRVKPLRLGHPTRIAEDLREFTVETLAQSTEEYRRAQALQNEARALRAKYQKQKTSALRSSRGAAAAARDWLTKSNQLNAEARRAMKEARAKVLRRSRVVCTTAAGADSSVLGSTLFDVVVLDEATQAADPIALAALQRGKIAILAGDPCQLSPTLIDAEAAREGLASTLFERATGRWKPEATQLLDVQYRMHAKLMRFPSESMYGGRLTADPSVAARLLHELSGVMPDRERPEPWLYVDTAGAGWDEAVDEETQSTFNARHAERTAIEVRRLLERGVAAQDIAAITPYGAQVRLLRRLLADAVASGLEIGTVDGFQGREKEAVVVDLVRSNAGGALGFLNDTRRMNVALTRAKRCLVIVADSRTLNGHDYYRRLLLAAEADGVREPV
jgi:ATP-dependent RNA/DNA helicase IGHMBP2